jgi:hypothetical protein
MAAARTRRRRKVGVDVEEARAGNMAREVQVAAMPGVAELPATVDELVAQGYQLPAGDGGSPADDGWIT